MFVGVLSTGTVSAADTTGTPKETNVPVSYDNRNSVVDPDDPLAEWSVSIPTAVAFAKDATTKKVDVELVPINGATSDDFTSTLSITVKAKSKNGMKLIVDGDTSGKDELSYTVAYGNTSLTGKTEATVATLGKTALKVEGTATLGTEKPQQRAPYADKLTYTITKVSD